MVNLVTFSFLAIATYISLEGPWTFKSFVKTANSILENLNYSLNFTTMITSMSLKTTAPSILSPKPTTIRARSAAAVLIFWIAATAASPSSKRAPSF
mgnify:CR=1 FL=1